MIGELICGQFVPSFYENHFKRSQQMFEGDRGQLILAELVYGQLDEDNLVEQYGKKMCYLAQSCLRISPRERISIGQIIEHPALECASRSALIKTLLRKAYKDVCHQRIAHGARQFKSQRQFTEGDRQGPGAMADTNRAQFEQMLNVLDESVPVPRLIHERLHPDTELEQAGKYIAVRITFALCPFRSLATSHVFVVSKNASPWQSDGEIGKHVYALCKRKIVSMPDFFTISPRISDQLHSARLKNWKGGQVQQVIRLKQYDGEYDRYRLNGYIQVNLDMEPSAVLKWMKHYGAQFESAEDGVKEEEQRTPRVHHKEQPIAVLEWMKFESGEDGVKEETDHQ